MRVEFGQLVARNWQIKLAALFLAVMLYIAVQAQHPIRQTFELQLALQLPPGRSLRETPPPISVVVTGKGSELLKLRFFPRTITKTVPDTLSASVWTIHLQQSDVELPKGADVQVAEISPRDVAIALDSVAAKDVHVVALITVVPESGYVVQGGLSVVPSIARVLGPGETVAAIESVTTVPTVITGVTGPFRRSVMLDTTALGAVRVTPTQVEVSVEAGALIERSFGGIPVETGAGALTSFVVVPPRVSVAVRGPEALVEALTRDSLKVIAHLTGPAADASYAHLTVTAPAGITARAVPDSVALRRRAPLPGRRRG